MCHITELTLEDAISDIYPRRYFLHIERNREITWIFVISVNSVRRFLLRIYCFVMVFVKYLRGADFN